MELDQSTFYDYKDLLMIYQEKRINKEETQQILDRLKLIAFSIAALDSVVAETNFKVLNIHFKKVFNNIKDIIVKYQF